MSARVMPEVTAGGGDTREISSRDSNQNVQLLRRLESVHLTMLDTNLGQRLGELMNNARCLER